MSEGGSSKVKAEYVFYTLAVAATIATIACIGFLGDGEEGASGISLAVAIVLFLGMFFTRRQDRDYNKVLPRR